MTKRARAAFLFVVAVLALGVIVQVLLPRHDAAPSATVGPYDAWTACRDAVTSRLKAPSTADFPGYSAEYVHADGDGYAVAAYVDADNGFGAHIRTRFTCHARRSGNTLIAEGVTTE